VNAVASVTPLTALERVGPVRDGGGAGVAHARAATSGAAPDLSFKIYGDFAAVETEWRRFERVAEMTPFQTFDWLATWYRHIGLGDGVRPAIVVGRFADGETAFIFPLGVAPAHWTQRLCWLGETVCDYHAPLLAAGFAQRVTPARFLALWRELRARLQGEPRTRHDWIELEKMPETVGGEINPFTFLDVRLNASGAHSTRLGEDWETFYFAKRSSATRRRDRAKRKNMAAFGDVRFVTAADADDAEHTLATLMQQKSRALARKGIADMFAPAGHRAFFLDLASNPALRHFIHVSRIEIGANVAAVNLGVVFGDCYYHVLASYDEEAEAARYGPGILHVRELLAYAISLGLARFDFTIGDEPYKLEWSDAELRLFDHVAAVTARGVAAARASMLRRRVKRFLKQTPWAWRAVCLARSTVGALAQPRPARPRPRSTSLAADGRSTLACVMGDIDLLRPLALAGIPCAVVTRPGVPSLYSRAATLRLPWHTFAPDDATLVDALVALGEAQREPPVLFYEEDAQLLLVSRFRGRLARAFRFVIADAGLVEDLLDKARFQALAERHGLPVPAARRFDPSAIGPGDLGLRFPVLVKPVTRLDAWNERFGLRKAVAAENLAALQSLWPQLRDLGLALLAQELVPGAEARIESYHCYVDGQGGIAAEFTGRKLRTYPAHYGHTTALEITDAPDVRAQGRAAIEKLGLTGVAKLDFKRDMQGKLRLLEINPRFNLWHHAGAVAGVNIPALVYADLLGIPRPPFVRARAGVRWCRAWKDLPAARADGVSLTQWLAWFLGCEAKSALFWDDPMPFVRSSLFRVMRLR
jgi:CelD/BcsL family acetyltransferase involved in cellulose biosynthesis/predicted ATP-grasp superfamily ATP-dependent carboligase